MKILLAGEGGQGIQVIAQILAKASFIEGKYSLYIPNFGVEQRGGVSLAFLVIEDKLVYYPKFKKADIVAILSSRSFDRVKQYINAQTLVILGPAINQVPKLESKKTFFVNKGNFPAKVWNLVVLGIINHLGKIVKKESLLEAMNERFITQFKKDPHLKELDLKALNI